VDVWQAIDGGWIPSDLLEDIPCKYINGCVICEVEIWPKEFLRACSTVLSFKKMH
jgi:hypothetical protein